MTRFGFIKDDAPVEVIFFKELPHVMTLLGAVCMLTSVVIMALPSTTGPELELKGPVGELEATDTDETESLGSFVASEVSFRSNPSRSAHEIDGHRTMFGPF